MERIERIHTSTIEQIGDQRVVQYRGGALPLCELSQIMDIKPSGSKEQQEIIVFRVCGRELGLMINPPLDTFEVILDIDENSLKQPGILGSMIIKDHTTLIINVVELARVVMPDWF